MVIVCLTFGKLSNCFHYRGIISKLLYFVNSMPLLFFFFLINLFLYLFFGCVGSSFLCEGFL